MVQDGRPARARAGDHARLVDVLVDTITDYAVFALDVEGHIVTWNPGAERLTGYRAEEIIGHHFSRLCPDDDRAAGKPDRELAIAVADGHYEEEAWRLRNDGTLFWASVVLTALRGSDGRLLGFGKILRDVTERKRSEDALRESEERFRLLVSTVTDYAIFLLDPDGKVASWNAGAQRLKGYGAEDIIGRHLSTFYTEPDRRSGLPAAALAEAKANGRWENEGWRVRRDGTRFWANVVITSLVSADGEHRGFAKVTRDLTDRKRNEDALRGVLERERTAAAQLRDLDRMRSELVSIVAHDLRSPAGVVQHLLHVLRTDWATSSDDDKFAVLDRIDARIGRLAAMADDLFEVSRIDAGQLFMAEDRIDVGTVVEQVVLDAKAETPERVVRGTVGPDVHAIGDERRSWQVIANLVSNALKYSPDDTPVDIVVERVGAEVVVIVTDRGPGIPADQFDLLFERFSRLPHSGNVPGSGIGLFIAQSLAEAQGGSLGVESTPGEGASFRFTLPAAP